MPDRVVRAATTRAVLSLLDAARSKPAGLGLEGEAGIGKTTVLLDAMARARADGFLVLGAAASPTESLLAFAVVSDLLRDVDAEVLASLPEVQRVALDRVLLRHTDPGLDTDHRVTGAALLAVIESCARSTPVLIALDDIQWLDESSRTVLTFALRRLQGPVAVLATERCEPGRASGWLNLGTPNAVRRHRVGPMSLGALHAILTAELGRSFPRPLMARIARSSGGNPFYALELGRSLSDGDLGGEPALPASLSELVRNRVEQLDPGVRRVLLAAAVAVNPTLDLVSKVLDQPVEQVAEALDTAERHEVVTVSRARIRFAHPLLSEGIYQAATASERRQLHRAYAEVKTQPELRARHLALASTGPDPTTIAALDAAALDARSRGAPAAAAELLELAIGLGDDSPVRTLMLADHHIRAGAHQRATELLTPLSSSLRPGTLRAMVRMALGAMYIYGDSYLEAAELLQAALADAEGLDALKVQILLPLSFAEGNAARFDAAIDHARTAVQLAESQGAPALLSQALANWAIVSGSYGLGFDQEALQRALEYEDVAAETPIPFRARANEVLVLAWTGRLSEATAKMARVRQRCADRGAESDMIFVSGHSTMIAVWRGHFAEALRLADECIERAEQLGGEHTRIIGYTVRGYVHAHLGNEAETRADVATALTAAARCGSQRMTEVPAKTLGLLEVSLRDYQAAADVLEPVITTFNAHPFTEMMTAFFIPVRSKR